MSLTHGKDANNNLVPLLLDTSGKVLIYGTLQVQLVAGAAVIGHVIVDTAPIIEVTSTQADKIISWDSNFSAGINASVLAAGTNTLVLYTVPANYAARLTQVAMEYHGTVANVILEIAVVTSSPTLFLAYVKPPVADQFYCYNVDAWLNAGDIVQMRIFGATLSDTASCNCNGYLMHNT